MEQAMWSASKIDIPEFYVKQVHLRVLDEAVKNASEFDVRSAAVYEALDYLQKNSLHTWGFTVFREALEQNCHATLQKGLELIRKHLGAKPQ